MKRILIPTVGLAVCTACAFDEGLVIENMEGRIILPPEAATQSFFNEDGTLRETVTDVRMIGPVYVGLYPTIEEGAFPYPHPSTGPSLSSGRIGDAYPYGGTTVGDFRFACFEDLTCNLVSGRHLSYDSIIEWMGVFDQPLLDAFGQPVETGAYIQQVCFEQNFYTSDEEVRLIQTKDTNDDGVVDALDLDFVERADGNFEGRFRIWQQEFVSGFTAWSFMDAPNNNSMTHTTCNPDAGAQQRDYSVNIQTGTQYQDVLNYPSTYLTDGDWVGSIDRGTHTYVDVFDDVEIWIDVPVEQ